MKLIRILIASNATPSSRWAIFAPLSRDEKLIVPCITFTFIFYLIGALYLVAPVLGWSLLIGVVLTWSSGKNMREQNSYWLIVIWLIGCIVMEISLIIAHIDFGLGFAKIIKSSIG
jgi:hypothetical protein